MALNKFSGLITRVTVEQTVWDVILQETQPVQVYSWYKRSVEDLQKQLADEFLTNYSSVTPEYERLYTITSGNLARYVYLFLQKESSTASLNSSVTSGSAVSHSVNFKLPVVKIPTFEGKASEWDNFWALFDNIVHSKPDLSNVIKFNFLISSLKGEALEIAKTIPVTDYNYDLVIQQLKKRYDQVDIVLEKLLISLQNLQTPKHTAKELFKFLNQYQMIVAQYTHKSKRLLDDRMVISIILTKLLPETRTAIKQFHKKTVFNLTEIEEALEFFITSKEAEEMYAGASQSKVDESVRPKDPKYRANNQTSSPNTSQRTRTNTTSNSNQPINNKKNTSKVQAPGTTSSFRCQFCEQPHKSSTCPTHNTPESRMSIAITKKLCFNCLKQGHSARECNSTFKCMTCSARHHTSLCQQKAQNAITSANMITGTKAKVGTHVQRKPKANVHSKDTSKHESTMLAAKGSTALLRASAVPTATVQFISPKHKRASRVFFDTGSQRSYISSSLAEELKLKPMGEVTLTVTTFGQQQMEIRCPIVKVNLHLGKFKIAARLLVHDKVEMQINTPGLTQVMSALVDSNYRVVDQPTSDEVTDIQAIIGIDYFHKFILGTGKYKEVNIFKTAAGVIPYGPMPRWATKDIQSRELAATQAISVCCRATTEENELSEMWELENVGLNSEKLSPNDRIATEMVQSSLEYKPDTKQYQVKLPFTEKVNQLPSNFGASKAQLDSLYNGKLRKDNELREHYKNVFSKYLELGFTERVPIQPNDGHFLPHHAVIKDSLTTPVRAVFNASSKRKDGVSLNDCLYTGPSLVNLLFDQLVGFRKSDHIAIADISKAFHRILVHPEHRKYLKFLTYQDNKLCCFQFRCVPFGVTTSPFLLQQVLNHHLKTQIDPIAEQILRGFYVDNLIVHADSEQELIEIKPRIDQLLDRAGMPLQSWISNNEIFNTRYQVDEPIIQNVLGMRWDTDTDTLTIKMPSLEILEKGNVTKRTLLQQIGKIFDPLGIINPLIIRLKIAFQNAWKEKLSWDQPVPEGLYHEVVSAIKLLTLQEFHVEVPRNILNVSSMLFLFSDASLSTYGCAAYAYNPNHVTNLICSKVKLSPLKSKVTIPKLELAALTLATRLAKTLVKQHPFADVKLFTDSQVAIAWVQNPHKSKDVFVANRATEISNSHFKVEYIESLQNPADLLTKSNRTKNSLNLWLHGPEDFNLNHLSCQIPQYHDNTFTVSILDKDEIEVNQTRLFELSKHKNFIFWQNVARHVRRLISRYTRNLTPFEMLVRQEQIIYCSKLKEYLVNQSNEFNDALIKRLHLQLDTSKDLIVSSSRIQGRDGTINVTYLPKSSPLTYMLLEYLHRSNQHASPSALMVLFMRYATTTNLRPLCKSLIRDCVICRRYKSRLPARPPLPPLPTTRTELQRPFQHSTLDHAGFYVLEDNTKVWIFLATCLASRAIWLDVTSDLSSTGLLQSLRRLSARHGTPSSILMDNFSSYRNLAQFERELASSSLRATTFQFIAPRAPWKNGVTERLVGIVKSSIATAIGKKKLSLDFFRTILKEAEAVINNRPLTYIEDDDQFQPLTPSMIVNGRQLDLSPLVETEEWLPENMSTKDVRRSYQKLHQIYHKFKQQFDERYVKLLSTKRNLRNNRTWIPRKDQVVILKNEENRARWPLVRIHEVFEDPEGVIRTVEVFDGKRIFRRDPSLLLPLEWEEDNRHIQERETPEADETEQGRGDTEEPRPRRKAALRQREFMKKLQRELLE